MLFTTISCKNNNQVEVKFSDEINRYNFLDKPHKLRYVYDFENLLSESEYLNLSKKLQEINKDKNIVFIFISDNNPIYSNFKEGAIITNNIFKTKYNLENLITIEVSKISRKIAITYSKELNNKVNDSICRKIIKSTIKPNFKNEYYFKGIVSSVDLLLNYLF